MPSERPEPGALMVFWSNIAREHQRRYQLWHNAEHMPERLRVPGFLLGRRYRDVEAVDRFLMCYDTRDLDALTSEAYRHALDHPTEWTREALTWFKEPVRNVYVLDAATALPTEAPVLVLARRSPPDAAAGRLPDGPRDPHAFDWLRGLMRVADYALDADGSRIRTREAGIHGALAEESGGLTWIECHDLRLVDAPVWSERLDASLRAWHGPRRAAGLERCRVHTVDFVCHPLTTKGDPA